MACTASCQYPPDVFRGTGAVQNGRSRNWYKSQKQISSLQSGFCMIFYGKISPSFFTCADGCIAHDQIHLQSHLLNLPEKCWHECSASKLVSKDRPEQHEKNTHYLWTSERECPTQPVEPLNFRHFSSILLHISRQKSTCLQISCFFQQMPRTLPVLWDGGGVADNCSWVGSVELWMVETPGLSQIESTKKIWETCIDSWMAWSHECKHTTSNTTCLSGCISKSPCIFVSFISNKSCKPFCQCWSHAAMVALKVITSENPCRRMEIACCHSLWKLLNKSLQPKTKQKNKYTIDFFNEQIQKLKFIIMENFTRTPYFLSKDLLFHRHWWSHFCLPNPSPSKSALWRAAEGLTKVFCPEMLQWGNKVQYLTNEKCHKEYKQNCSNLDLHSKSWRQMNSDWLYSCCCRHSPHGISSFLRVGDSSASADFLSASCWCCSWSWIMSAIVRWWMDIKKPVRIRVSFPLTNPWCWSW